MKKKFLLHFTILTMRATNIKATRGAVTTKAVAVGGRACARELYTMKQCCLGSGDCCLYSTDTGRIYIKGYLYPILYPKISKKDISYPFLEQDILRI
jgi:hypothetical protein